MVLARRVLLRKVRVRRRGFYRFGVSVKLPAGVKSGRTRRDPRRLKGGGKTLVSAGVMDGSKRIVRT